MLRSTKQRRAVVQMAHLGLSLPLGFLLYAAPELTEHVRLGMQVLGFPVLVLTGLWMWLAPRFLRR